MTSEEKAFNEIKTQDKEEKGFNQSDTKIQNNQEIHLDIHSENNQLTTKLETNNNVVKTQSNVDRLKEIDLGK